MAKIVIIGSSNTDMVLRCAHLPLPGETILGGEFMMNAGGKGANQAVAVARMGAEAIFVAKVGDDVFGKHAIDNFKQYGINTDCVGIASEYSSGVALITVDAAGENSIAVASGANAALTTDDIDAAAEYIIAADIVLMQLETPLPTVTHAAKIARKAGVKVVLNSAPAPDMPLPAELLENIDIIIPNRTELATLTATPDLADGVAHLYEHGISTVIVTLGGDGALICDGRGARTIPSFRVTPIDTTAAGDTFCGALCVALAEGADIDAAVLFANKAAAISVTRVGAQRSVPSRSEVDKF